MSKQLRKTIVIPFTTDSKDEEVIINVSWDILEKVERVYGTSAEYVAAQILVNLAHVQRHKIAQVLQLWCQGKNDNLKQIDIAEAVQTASQKQFYIYVGMVQAAVLWSIRGPEGDPLITDQEFDLLVSGEDIPPKPQIDNSKLPEGGQAKPKKPRAATSKKRTG